GLRSRRSQRVFALSVAALGFLAILAFPYARAAGVALTVSTVATVVLSYPRRWAALAALALVLAASGLILLNAPLRGRFWSSPTPAGSGERAGLLTAGLNAVSSHPLVGIGLGRFRPSQFADPNSPEEVLEHPGKAHNQFVTLAAEMGLPGLLLFGVLIL